MLFSARILLAVLATAAPSSARHLRRNLVRVHERTAVDGYFYMCSEPNWAGKCHPWPYTADQCYSLQGTEALVMGNIVQSAGTDKNHTCSLYITDSCSGAVPLEFSEPGSSNFIADGLTKSPTSFRSWKCVSASTAAASSTSTPPSSSIAASAATSTSADATLTGSVTTPSPVQPSSIVSGCYNFAQVAANDTCVGFAQTHGITPQQLYDWNGILGPAGQNCSKEFEAGYWYCIAVLGGSSAAPVTSTTAASVPSGSPGTFIPPSPFATPTSTVTISRVSTSSASGTASTVPVPSPIQPNSVPADCDAYQVAEKGEYCSAFAARVAISEADLYAWNTVLGANGADCTTEFWAGYNYCVGISGTISAGSSSAAGKDAAFTVTAPPPTSTLLLTASAASPSVVQVTTFLTTTV